ncbi:helix-turn-helix transcriptional regulator [Roseinatronobacter alkalisoli]|uniref:Helix-turn-helix transcriptional regulator n=1 Tax=Roseinatronobacter alkalisoli TaxID=3028235 RepID=A0ABT5T516_9RHOB|nr:helix-turn-helix transcriptional regulator [Roseinatronobacter sp. HJB301]MDD7970215.1 helix-turn-helix transcriptional regulator [Roseinatronobacter sp. HJB301]
MSETGQGKMTSSEQLRAARAMIGLSQADLASMTGRTDKTIRRAETDVSLVAADTVAALRAALEAAGVVFLSENGNGPGVALKRKSND